MRTVYLEKGINAMKCLRFQCELLSDIVISATTRTEGGHKSLDYIPGSVFLGIAAKHYDAFGEDAFNVFHSGRVSFRDGHPLSKDSNERALRMPAAWFIEKGKKALDSSLYTHHHISQKEFQNFSEQGIQLRQIRNGYFLPKENKILREKKKSFSIKSAYDPKTRCSREGQLFGYEALPGGTFWDFELMTEAGMPYEKIKKILTGDHLLGKSRSAQYGRCRISFLEEKIISTENQILPGEVALYAASHCAFYDHYGQPSFTPNLEELGIREAVEILWEKSQLIPFVYAPWNNTRKARDANRVCVRKGSVLLIKTNAPLNPKDYAMGIGSHRNEGFGHILFHPQFLEKNDSFILKESVSQKESAPPAIVQSDPGDPVLKKWLTSQSEEKKFQHDILQAVNEFAHNYQDLFDGKFASQWGEIRALAQKSNNADELYEKLFHKDEQEKHLSGYLMHGRSQERWKKKGRRKQLEDFLKTRKHLCPKLCVRLAAQMAKQARGK